MNKPRPTRRQTEERASARCYHLADRGGAAAALRDLRAYLEGAPDGWVMSGDLVWRGDGSDHTLRPLDDALEAAGGCYIRFEGAWVLAAPTRWRLHQALRRADPAARRLGLEAALAPSHLGRSGEGVEFLGRRVTPFAADPSAQAAPISEEQPGDPTVPHGEASPSAAHYPPHWSHRLLGGGAALYTLLATQPLAAATSLVAPDATGSLDLDGIPPHDVGVSGFLNNCYVSRLYSANIGAATSASATFGSATPSGLSAAVSQTVGAVPHYVRVLTSGGHYGWLTIDRSTCKASYWIGAAPRVATLRPDGSGLPSAPTVSDQYITITSSGSGTGGAYRVGDTIRASWNNSAGGDNNSESITGVTMDFSPFGGGAAVAASDSADVWSADYTITEDGGGSIDATNRNVSVTATDAGADTTTTSDSTNLTIDNDSPGTPAVSGGGTLDVDEGAANGTVVGTLTSEGIDGVTLSLTDTAGGRFAINPGGVLSVADGTLLDNETGASHAITARATDDAGNTTDATLTVNVNDINERPTVDLNGAAAGSEVSVHFAAGDGATTLAAAAVLNEPEGENLNQLVITIINGQAGDELAVGVRGDGAVGNGISIAGTDTSTLTLSGSASAADYQTLAREVTFDNTTPGASTVERTITFTARDDLGGTGESVTATVIVNAAPTLSGAGYSFSATDAATATTGLRVSDLLGDASITAADGNGDTLGIAVTATSGSGGWQFSTDNASWTAFGTPSDASALLLAESAYLRYLPDGSSVESATLTFRAWDQSRGTASTNGAPGSADTTTNGGVSAYSSATVVATLAVLNSRPTLSSSGGGYSATPTDATTPSAGVRIADLLGDAAITAADINNDTLGIAVTASSGAGGWQYSTDNAGWTALGTLSETGALLLAESAYLRYLPDGTRAETATLTFRAWDQRSGTASTNGAPSSADSTAGGASGAFSSATAGASLVVLNSAPTLSAGGGGYSFTATDANHATSGLRIADLLGDAAITAADANNDALGVAVTAAGGSGNWQFSTDNATWTALGTPSAASAPLLADGAYLRYVPDGSTAETATITFRAWDQSAGTASSNGALSSADTTTNGGSSAYSSGSVAGSLTVAAVVTPNSAPLLSASGGGYTFTPTAPNSATSGLRVSDLLGDAAITAADGNGDTLGIAVTASSGVGGWQFSTDNVGWTALGAPSDSSALLLSDASYLRYVPDGTTAETATITFRAWDRSSGSASTNDAPSSADTTTNGGGSAFSSGAVNGSLVVLNSAPTLTLSGGGYSAGTTDAATPSAALRVSDLLGDAAITTSDANGDTLGIVVTATSGVGGWQFSTDNATWTAFGTLSDASALLLAESSYLRYVPDGSSVESATFTFRAWDQSSGTASSNGAPSHADATTTGGGSAFSSGSVNGSLAVLNSAPTLTVSGGGYSLPATSANTISSVLRVSALLADTALTTGDINNDTLGIAVTAAGGAGSWQFSSDNVSWTTLAGHSTTNALLLAESSYLRYVPDGSSAETATLTFRVWDQRDGTASANGAPSTADTSASGGASAFSSATGVGSLTVTAVVTANSAPILSASGSGYSFPSTGVNSPSAAPRVADLLADAGITVADGNDDTLGIAVIATSGAGAWKYSTDNATWTPFGSPSEANALLLADSAYLRFEPDGSTLGTATFTFRAWDQSSGTASEDGVPRTADTTTNGGGSAFSSGTVVGRVEVVAQPIDGDGDGSSTISLPSGGGTVTPAVGTTLYVQDNGADGTTINLPPSGGTGRGITVNLPGSGAVGVSADSGGSQVTVERVVLAGESEARPMMRLSSGSATVTANGADQAMLTAGGVTIVSGSAGSQASATVDSDGRAVVAVAPGDRVVVNSDATESVAEVELLRAADGSASPVSLTNGAGETILIEAGGDAPRIRFTTVEVNGRSVALPSVVSGSITLRVPLDSAAFLAIGAHALEGGGEAVTADARADANGMVTLTLSAGRITIRPSDGDGDVRRAGESPLSELFAGETAAFNGDGSVRVIRLGSLNRDGGWAGDRLGDALEGGDLVVTRIGGDSSRHGMALTERFARTIAALSGQRVEDLGQDPLSGVYRLRLGDPLGDPFGGTARIILGWPVSDVIVEQGPDQATPNGNGMVRLRSGNYAVNIAPAVAGAERFAGRLREAGLRDLNIGGSGVIFASDPLGNRIVAQPAWEWIEGGAAEPPFTTDEQGVAWWNGAEGGRQAIHPVFAQPISLHRVLAVLDPAHEVVGIEQGVMTVRFAGERFDLIPDYAMIPAPAEHAADAWWEEGGRYFIHYPTYEQDGVVGWVQAFRVEARGTE